MHRVLFEFGPVTIFSYGVMMVTAFVTATWLAGRNARRLPAAQGVLGPSQVVDLFCLAMLGGVLGARLFFVAQHWEAFAHQPQEIPAIWHGGLVWYGGFLGGLTSMILYLRVHRLSVLRGFDQIIPFVPLGHALGRIGCFLNGCCYGKPTDAWCGIVFVEGEPARIPTQLLEAGSLLLLFLALRRLQEQRSATAPGWLFGAYLMGYAVIRFFIEFLRGDQAVVWAGLTLQQLLSVGVLLTGVALLRRRLAAHGS